MQYLIGAAFGLIAGYILAVLINDGPINTATAKANAKYTVPFALVLAIVVGIMAWQQTQIQTLMPYAEAFEQMAKDKGVDLDSKSPVR